MTVATMRAVEAAAPVCSGAAKFATALIADMFVVLVRAVQTAGTKSSGVTKSTCAHLILCAVNMWGRAAFLRLRSSRARDYCGACLDGEQS